MNKALALGLIFSWFLVHSTRSAHFTTAIQQPITGADWNQNIWEPGALPATAGNTYECVAGGNPTRIRNPYSGSGDPVIGVKTFPGDSLRLDVGAEIRAKGVSGINDGVANTLDFPGVGGNPGLILNGGNLDAGENEGFFGLTGIILVESPSSFTSGDGMANYRRGWRVTAEIRGAANLTVSKGSMSGFPAVELINANNPFSGGWTVNGGIFKATGFNSLGSGNIIINPGLDGASFQPNYDINTPGTLTLNGAATMFLHQNCRFGGLIIDGHSVANGTYSFAELTNAFPGRFTGFGTGSIAVGPPSPTITRQPQDEQALEGNDVTFTVAVAGVSPLRFQWRFNGLAIPDATDSSLLITNVQPAGSGTIDVEVSNAYGTVLSAGATLLVGYALRASANGNGTLRAEPNLSVYPPGATVSLTAVPNANSDFNFWSGDAGGSANPLSVAMTSHKMITANFGSAAITMAIQGQGSISKSPEQGFYSLGQQVTLTAVPGRWFAFTRWGDFATANPRVITVSTNNNYTAIFSPTTQVETLTFSNVTRTAPVGMPVILIDDQFVVTGAVTRLGSARIELLTTFPNGTVLYTLDGGQPLFDSSLYTDPFNAARTVTIRAVAWDANFTKSWEADPVQVIIASVYSLNATTLGGGTIGISPTNASYLSNTVVTLVATPEPGWTFLQWLGDANGTNATNSVVMTRRKCVEAIFGTSLNTTTAGSGSVVMQPSAALYPFGTKVRLTARPQAGNAFALWGNAGNGTNNPLLYAIIDSNRTVSAVFAPLSAGQYALAVVADGFGSVNMNPRGNRFTNGINVTLTAAPDTGQSFLGWIGDASGTQNPLPVVMNSTKVITALFTKRPRLEAQPCSEPSPKDGFQFLLTGEFGARYQLEKNDDWKSWSPLAFVTNSFGAVQFNDLSATNQSRRIYRAVAP